MEQITLKIGNLAHQYCGVRLPLQVLQSQAGFYIGTAHNYGPCSRESHEYFPTRVAAEQALSDDDWTQRNHP